jgi:hypothetical protein
MQMALDRDTRTKRAQKRGTKKVARPNWENHFPKRDTFETLSYQRFHLGSITILTFAKLRCLTRLLQTWLFQWSGELKANGTVQFLIIYHLLKVFLENIKFTIRLYNFSFML